MKVAILSESPADDAAIRILVEGLLGVKTEPVSHVGLRTRGWPSVGSVFPTVLKQLHYHSDADGLVLVVDSNGAPIHQAAHEKPGGTDRRCRLCQLRLIRDEVVSRLPARVAFPTLQTAISIAVPTIEAWLLCPTDPHVSEAAQQIGLDSGRYLYTKSQLKVKLYGTARPSLSHETSRMTEAATQLAGRINTWRTAFPSGYAALAGDLLKWRK